MLKAEDGFGKYDATASGVGEKTYGGVIRVKDPATGKYKFYPFEGKYQAAPKSVVVSPTKMNVLYIGVDNPMEISVPGVAQTDVTAALNGSGSLDRNADGTYTARVTAVGKCHIAVNAKIEGKVQAMGDKEFRIKRIPDPIPTLGGRLRGGNTQPGSIRAQSGIVALLENFDFEARFNVVSFEMVFSSKGEIFKAETPGPLFSQKMKEFIDRARPKDIIFIDEIKVVGPDKLPRKLGQIAFTII
jgi:gliding motility-associated protein GldM